MTPSAGDGSSAQWRIETSKPPFARPLFWLTTRPNVKKDARRASIKIEVPYTVQNTTTTLEEPVAKILATVELVVSGEIPTPIVNDAVAYISSMLADANVILALKSQIAPR